jgi:hypothetical protein
VGRPVDAQAAPAGPGDQPPTLPDHRPRPGAQADGPRDHEGPPTLGSAFGTVFAEYARLHGKARWGDKRRSTTWRSTSSCDSFPTQIVHIVRDPRASMASLKGCRGGPTTASGRLPSGPTPSGARAATRAGCPATPSTSCATSRWSPTAPGPGRAVRLPRRGLRRGHAGAGRGPRRGARAQDLARQPRLVGLDRPGGGVARAARPVGARTCRDRAVPSALAVGLSPARAPAAVPARSSSRGTPPRRSPGTARRDCAGHGRPATRAGRPTRFAAQLTTGQVAQARRRGELRQR